MFLCTNARQPTMFYVCELAHTDAFHLNRNYIRFDDAGTIIAWNEASCMLDSQKPFQTCSAMPPECTMYHQMLMHNLSLPLNILQLPNPQNQAFSEVNNTNAWDDNFLFGADDNTDSFDFSALGDSFYN